MIDWTNEDIELLANRFDDALAKFKRVVEVDPQNVYARVGLIQVYFQQGRIRDVIRHAKDTIGKIGPTKGPMREIVEFWAS